LFHLLPFAAMIDVSIYRRTGRPVWYVSYPCPIALKRVHRATQFRLDDPEGRRKAYHFALQRAKESRVYQQAESERWSVWAQPFLEQHYRRQKPTLQRYLISWKWLSHYFELHKIPGPRALTFEHVRAYHEWRTGFVKRTGRSVSHNTALLDIKALQVLMNEAIRRGWCVVNPCDKLGISRTPAREKPEITDEQMSVIIAALDERVARDPSSRWMRVAWEIARWHGCRLRETQLDLRTQVDLKDGLIKFRGKGHHSGQPKIRHNPIHPRLRPMLEQMIRDGHTRTCTVPELGSRAFREFFDALHMPDVCFHCSRVTVITKMVRADVSLPKIMDYVGHADEEVNRIYRRLKARDLASGHAAIDYADTPAPPQNPGSAPATA
jgi:hypothetical protein